jgi:transcriptional regulator with XRE-family HTH domain
MSRQPMHRPRKTAFGELLQKYRQERNISLRRLAELLDGIWTLDTIGKYERGERTPPASFLVLAARALGLTEKAEWALVDAWVTDALVNLALEYLEAQIQHNR